MTFVVGLALGIRGTLRRLAGEEHAAAVALVALPFAFALHSLVDLTLDFLAVAAPTMLVSATLLGAGRPAAARAGGLVTAGVAVAAVAAAWVLVAPALSTRSVETAYRQIAEGQARVSGLCGAARSAPESSRARASPCASCGGDGSG